MLRSPRWRALWRYYATSPIKAVGIALVTLLPAVFVAPVPLLIKRLLDVTIPEGDRTELILIGLALLALQVAAAMSASLALYLVLIPAKRGIVDLRDDVCKKLYSVSVGYLGRTEQEVQYDYVVRETQRVEWMSSALFGRAIPALILGFGITVVLVIINWQLLLLTFVFVPLMYIANRFVGGRLRRRVAEQNQGNIEFSEGVNRLLRLMTLTRARAAEDLELERQHRLHGEVSSQALNVEWTRNLYAGTQRSLVAMSLMFVLLAGGIAVIDGSITLGELFSFYAGVALLRNPAEMGMGAIPLIIAGRHSLDRLLVFLDEPDGRPYHGTERIEFDGTVDLEDVTFAYDDTPVLTDVSVSTAPGRVTALVGPNGAGKSTVVNLLLGFYRPQAGTVHAGEGVPYDDIDIQALRQQIGLVAQAPIMVDGTIAENLGYGLLDVGRAELETAARLATADAFIERLPDGYDTVIGDGGVTLSGGQRQRLAIARALMRTPRLLILDEPTNHLDERSLREVLENLWALDDAPATLLISHDERALAGAHLVVHLDDGRVTQVDEAVRA